MSLYNTLCELCVIKEILGIFTSGLAYESYTTKLIMARAHVFGNAGMNAGFISMFEQWTTLKALW